MTNSKSPCPICDANISLKSDVEESEVIGCPDCKTQLVVDKILASSAANLKIAPAVEEDWGE